jgi:LuxR family maltose regulon positive regulatory protein
VTRVSAPPGSGKTVLLRSWIGEAGLGQSAAWVLVGPGECDPQRFWLSVLGALRQTSPRSGQVRAVTAALGLDGWAITERLLKDLAPACPSSAESKTGPSPPRVRVKRSRRAAPGGHV